MEKRTGITGKFVIGFDGRQHVLYEDGQVVYEGDRILFVGHDFDGRVDEEWDTGLSIVSPGFIDLDADVDTDHALLDVALYGRDYPPEKMWEPRRERREKDPYSDEDFYIRQKYSMAQLIMNGITTAMPIAGEQFHCWGQSYHEFEIMAETAAELGLRVYLGPSFKSAPMAGQPYDLEREEKSFAGALRYFQKYDGANRGMIRGFLNPCQISVTDPALLRRAKEFACEMRAPIRLHACEEDVEWQYMLPAFGKTTVDYFEEIGLLCPRLLMPHALTLKDSEIDKLAAHGVTVVHTPVAEINYGAALNSFAKYQARGVNLAMGTDAQPVDMIQNLRLAWDLDRLCEWRQFFTKYGEDGVMTDLLAHEQPYAKTTALDFFNAATINGAKALQREDLGRLSPGAKADIIVIDLDDLRVGPYEDPLRTLLISCVGNNVRHTVINGQVCMKDRRLIKVDEAKLRHDAQIVYEKYLGLYEQYDLRGRPLRYFCPPSAPLIKKPNKTEMEGKNHDKQKINSRRQGGLWVRSSRR